MTDPQLRQEVATYIGWKAPQDKPARRKKCGRRGSHIRCGHQADRWIDDPIPGAKETRARLEWRRPNGN